MVNSRYQAYLPDANGYINYSNEENNIWGILYNRQIKLIKNRACKDYIIGLEKLEFNDKLIPQPIEVSERLKTYTGWSVEPVPALIDFNYFFELLSKRKFPAASFIRCREDIDYLPEPDIFHELFGHCPMLTEPNFAEFVREVGKFGLTLNTENQIMLGRLFWFTVEFGLINDPEGIRIYGAGILSSKSESIYALESNIPKRIPFDLITALRTSYRYDEMQKFYFVINSYEELYNMINGKLVDAFKEAHNLGFLNKLNVSNEINSEYRSC
ncbi:MAG TPA: phenylalanine 4-monooxygenase [Burkholderiales bacterium]|nr:phenylalanine 4-monooxygenase [Burkholderiales bacterium]